MPALGTLRDGVKYSIVRRLIGVLYNLNSRRSISKVFAAKTLSGNFSNLQSPRQCRLTLVEVVPVTPKCLDVGNPNFGRHSLGAQKLRFVFSFTPPCRIQSWRQRLSKRTFVWLPNLWIPSILGSNYIKTNAPWQEVGLKFCEHFGQKPISLATVYSWKLSG
jgi:hypothetical protein